MQIAASDCELADGVHVADMLTMRMLAQMAEREHETLACFVESETLARDAVVYTRLVMMPDPRVTLPEVDFLEPECPKPGDRRGH